MDVQQNHHRAPRRFSRSITPREVPKEARRTSVDSYFSAISFLSISGHLRVAEISSTGIANNASLMCTSL